MKKVIVAIIVFFAFSPDIAARNIFRKKDKDAPRVTIGLEGSKKGISHINWAYKQLLFRIFNRDYFHDHLLPTDYISEVANPDALIDCRKINKIIKRLLKEIRKQKKQYTDFDILKDKNFSRYN